MKKKSNWKKFDFNNSSNLNGSPNTETNSLKDRNDSKKVEDTKSNNFYKEKIHFNVVEQLVPRKVEDLAVHSRKIKDVELWLQENVLQSSKLFAPILLLTGPTGAGKTATINVLCKTMGIQVVEWINPIDRDFEFAFSETQSSKFSDFFTQSKYNSLCSNVNAKKIILVEDFPNFVTLNTAEFLNVIEKCYNENTPVVFICTDTSSNKIDLAQVLFPQEVRDKFGITNISFNPCSITLLKNALKRAHSVMQSKPELFTIPSSDITEAIVYSSMGDIRCAVTQYHFAGLKGIAAFPIDTNNIAKSRGVKRKRDGLSSSTTIKSMLKNESLGFYHGLGRILNPKHIEIDGTWKIQCDFDALIEEFSTRPSNLIAFLHENYFKYFTDLNDVQKAAEILSYAQIFVDKWVDQQDTLLYGLWIAVLGLMIYNKHKASKWNQIRGPTKVKLKHNENVECVQLCKLDYSYYNIITNTNTFHTFKR